MTNEQDTTALVNMYRSLTSTSHGNRQALAKVHQQAMEENLPFYLHFVSHAFRNKAITDRDTQEVMSALCSVHKDQDARNVGLGALWYLRPYQVTNVLDFIKGRVVNSVKERDLITKSFPYKRTASSIKLLPPEKARERDGTISYLDFIKAKHPGSIVNLHNNIEKKIGRRHGEHSRRQTIALPADKLRIEIRAGMFRNVPNSFRTEIRYYLEQLEQNEKRFDGVVLYARDDLKRLYASLNMSPGDRAQKILFEQDVSKEESERLSVLKEIPDMSSGDQARALIEHNIPWTVAVSIVTSMAPTVKVALINNMTPNQVISNLSSLKEEGAYTEGSPTRQIIEQKLKKAQKDERVSAVKATVAADAAGLTGTDREVVTDVTDSQLRGIAEIRERVLYCIDASSSMQYTIELAIEALAGVIPATVNEYYVIAFNRLPYPIAVKDQKYDQIRKSLSTIKASGMTSLGICLRAAAKQEWIVDKVVYFTDEDHTEGVNFFTGYKEYREKMGISPRVVSVKVDPRDSDIEKDCKHLGVEYERIDWTKGSDFYSVPALIRQLASGGLAEEVMNIMMTPLLKRKAV